MARRNRAGRSDAGITTVELSVVAPLLIIWIMLVVQGALWWHAKQVADAAVAEAVDVAQLSDNTAADGEAAALDWLAQSGNLTNTSVSVDRSADRVTVTVQGDAPQLVPGWDWGVTAQAEGPVERFIPESER